MSGFVEKRKLPRIEIRWPATMITKRGLIKGKATNITVEGVFILFEDFIENPTLTETFLSLVDPAGQKIQVMGKPVWSNPDIATGMGLCFMQVSEEDRELLRETIEKYAEK